MNTMEKETPDSILRRVQKLMAIANDTRADSNEAAAAAAQAAKIMRKYQIEEADVIIASLRREDDLIEECLQPRLADWNEAQKVIPVWANVMAAKIGELTGARPVIGKMFTKNGIEPCVKFQGFSTDVKLSVYMMNFLTATIRRLRADFKKTYTFQTKGVGSLRVYNKGLTLGILDVLDREIEAMKADEVNEGTDKTSGQLIVAKAGAIIEKFGETRGGEKIKLQNGNEDSEFYKGYADGKAVSVKKAVGANTPETLQIK